MFFPMAHRDSRRVRAGISAIISAGFHPLPRLQVLPIFLSYGERGGHDFPVQVIFNAQLKKRLRFSLFSSFPFPQLHQLTNKAASKGQRALGRNRLTSPRRLFGEIEPSLHLTLFPEEWLDTWCLDKHRSHQ